MSMLEGTFLFDEIRNKFNLDPKVILKDFTGEAQLSHDSDGNSLYFKEFENYAYKGKKIKKEFVYDIEEGGGVYGLDDMVMDELKVLKIEILDKLSEKGIDGYTNTEEELEEMVMKKMAKNDYRAIREAFDNIFLKNK